MKIGLFFGTFNPIHIGHLILAEGILNYSDLHQIWFVVTPQNPSKTKHTLLADSQRLNLVREAIGDNIKFKVSDIEFNLPKPNYTAITLNHLIIKHPEHEFSLLIGQDNLRTFHTWYNYEKIINKHRILVYPREKQVDELIEEKGSEIVHSNIVVLPNVPFLKISSSHIRSLVKQGKSIQYLVPESVKQQIEERGFYKNIN